MFTFFSDALNELRLNCATLYGVHRIGMQDVLSGVYRSCHNTLTEDKRLGLANEKKFILSTSRLTDQKQLHNLNSHKKTFDEHEFALKVLIQLVEQVFRQKRNNIRWNRRDLIKFRFKLSLSSIIDSQLTQLTLSLMLSRLVAVLCKFHV
jgi:hypothetical protein